MLIQEQDVQQVANAMMNMLREDEIELINNFYAAVKAKEIEKIDELFKAVITELDTNFKTEEEMMDQSAYPDMQMHKSDHDLIERNLKSSINAGKCLKVQKRYKVF